MTRHDAKAGHSRVHRKVWELLPWYVNGTLDGREHQNDEAHLSTCAVCRAELARCRELAAAVHTAEEVSWSPSPEHLLRVLRRIDAAEVRRAQASDWWRRLRTRCLGYRASLQGTPFFHRCIRPAISATASMMRTSMTFVWVGPVISKSPRRSKNG